MSSKMPIDLPRNEDAPHALDLSRALDDFQIIAAQSGDRQAFSALVTRWHPRFMRLSARLMGNRDDAQDVVQDALISLSKCLHRLDDPQRFSAFCYAIIRRRAADKIKRNMRNRDIKAQARVIPPSPMADVDEALSLRQALRALPGNERLLLSLFYIDGFNGAEIAASLGVPLGTVKSRLFTARAHLKHIYLTPPQPQKGNDYDRQDTP